MESCIHLPQSSYSSSVESVLMDPQIFGPTSGIPNILKFMIPAIDNFMSLKVLWFSPREWETYFPLPANVLLLYKNNLLS